MSGSETSPPWLADPDVANKTHGPCSAAAPVKVLPSIRTMRLFPVVPSSPISKTCRKKSSGEGTEGDTSIRHPPGTTFFRFEGETLEKSSPQNAFHMCTSLGSCGKGPPSAGSRAQFLPLPQEPPSSSPGV